MKYGFIIPTCIVTDVHYRQLLRCLESIRRFHPIDTPIYLINERTPFSETHMNMDDEHIHMISSLNPGSADQQVFKVFLDYDKINVDVIIFIQDSMILNKPIPIIIPTPTIRFIWHFTNHRVHWDVIKEPITDYNTEHNIVTHSDLIRHNLSRDYNQVPGFVEFALHQMNNKHEWVGAFGSCVILSKNTLQQMNAIVPFVNKFVDATSNRDRRVNESIFSLIAKYCFPNKDFSNSMDGLYFDGYQTNQFANNPTGFDGLTWCAKLEHLSKISFQR